MFRDEGAGPGGAWLTLDPTPPANLRRNANLNSAQALDLARSMWQEYVLGLDADTQESWGSSGGLLGLLRLDSLSNSLQLGFSRVQQSPALRLVVIGGILTLLLGSVGISLLRKKRRKARRKGQPGFLRRLVGKALGMISPRFGQWILEGQGRGPVIPFYQRLVELLATRGWKRYPGETHREFLARVAADLGQSAAPAPSATTAASKARPEEILEPIESAFHAARFGGVAIPPERQQELERSLVQLEQLLPENSPAPKPAKREIQPLATG